MRPPLKHALLPRILLAFTCCLVALDSFPEGPTPDLAKGRAYAMPILGEISVRSTAVVNDKRLKLLDFCEPDRIPEEWKSLLAEVDLGPAPEVGRETNFKSQQIVRHIERLLSGQGQDPKAADIRAPERITVSRRQAGLTREQIEESFREFVLSKVPWKIEDLVIGPVSFSSIPALPAGRLSIEVTASPHERFMGDVSVTMHFHVDGREVRNMRVSGKVERYQEVIHSVRAMKRNEVIADADIQSVRVNVAAHPDRYSTQRDQVVGKRLLCSIGPNQPFSSRDLDQPSLVKRGDPVTILYQEEGIRLSTRGEAKESGGQGDRVRIRNVDSKKNILCQIIDAQTVEVLP
jgi:flagellar basal body P-ring formation protein FlgA